MAALLWANSIQEHPAAVAIVTDEYDADRATALYQLGVDEYLSTDEHYVHVETILLHLARSRPAPRAVVGVPVTTPRRSRSHSPTPGRVAVA